MIFIPFIYFSLLLFYILKTKKTFNLCALLVSTYVISSFFSIIIDYKGLYGVAGSVKASIELFPTLMYCLLITVSILPFNKVKPLNRGYLVPIKNIPLFNYIIYFYILIFVLFLYFFGLEIFNRLKDPDLAALRLAFTKGEDDLGFSKYYGIERIIARIIFIFASSAMFLQVFYFYSIAFLKKSNRFNITVLFLSSMPILLSILSMDRSKLVFWLMSYGAIAVFFWTSIQSKNKRKIKVNLIAFLSIILVYFSIITIARYGEHDIGAGNSLIIYAGQSFNNFCLFYNNLHPNNLSFDRITPVLSYIFESKTINKDFIINNQIDTNVFASFIGNMIKEIGFYGSVIYTSLFSIITLILFRKNKSYDITKIFLIVILMYIPYFGVFGLYYSTIDREISVWVILIICFFLKSSKKYDNSIVHSYK